MNHAQAQASPEAWLSRMSLEEKVDLCEGASFWMTKAMEAHGIPSLFVCNGPHGLRRQELESGADMLGINASRPATCFPTAVTTACSWDPELLEQIGAAIAEEAVAYDVDVVLGPGANLKRDPLCGRNFEYFSEDPLLSGLLAGAFIRGAQAAGAGTSLKHFACNNQEYMRFTSDSHVDDRTLRELYLASFELAVKEGRPDTVMCAYNRINGVYCSDNPWLLTQVLRKEWGFDGLVMTDWGAMHNRVEAFRAGCDLNMPGGSGYMREDVLRAVRDGILAEADVDRSARRVLALAAKAVARRGREKNLFDEEAHHDLAVRAAEQGAVLLQNRGVLPIGPEKTVALIGDMAKHPRYQGAGSSHIQPLRLDVAADCLPHVRFAAGYQETGDTADALLAEAVEAARQAEVAVVFAGLPGFYESEGFDRENLDMPAGHLTLIEAVAAVNPNTVVVLHGGGVMACPWADQVNAILYVGLPGQGGGQAAANLLTGVANPGGKLAESWPIRYEDCPTSGHYRNMRNAQYREGVLVGYRYYQSAGVPVRWPFGYGLSYTTFTCTELQVEPSAVRAEHGLSNSNGLRVSVCVTNTGDRAGAEVVQLYVTPPRGGVYRPERELRGFQRMMLEPGESRTVTFSLDDRSFSVWQEGWRVQTGEYLIRVGTSSSDLSLQATVCMDGEELAVPGWQQGNWVETRQGKPSLEGWEAMLGRSVVEGKTCRGSFTLNSTVEEMCPHSLVMRVMRLAVRQTIAKGLGGKKAYGTPEFRMMMASSVGSPLRNLQIAGGLKGSLVQGLLDMANGHFFKGLRAMMRG